MHRSAKSCDAGEKRTTLSCTTSVATTCSILLRIAVFLTLMSQPSEFVSPGESTGRVSMSSHVQNHHPRQRLMRTTPSSVSSQIFDGETIEEDSRKNSDQIIPSVDIKVRMFYDAGEEGRVKISRPNVRLQQQNRMLQIPGNQDGRDRHPVVLRNGHLQRIKERLQRNRPPALREIPKEPSAVDLINRAKDEKIFGTPEEWAAKNNQWISKNQNFLPPPPPAPAPPPAGISSRSKAEGEKNGSEKRSETAHGDALRDGSFVFPVETEGIISPKNMFIPKLRPECRGNTVCEKIESYPTEYVKNVVKNLKELMSLAGTDVMDNIAQRIDPGATGDTPLCQSSETVYFPEGVQKDMNDENSWHTVVNVDSFKQGLRIATCTNRDNECMRIDGLTGDLAPGYAAVCRQQYVQRKMVVLSRENGTAVADSFPIPSSCCCHVKFNGFPARFGENSGNVIRPTNRRSDAHSSSAHPAAAFPANLANNRN